MFGKFHELPRKYIHFFNHPRWGVSGQKASSSKNVSRECSYPERWRSRVIRGWREGGADGMEGTGREREAGREGEARVKPGNQLEYSLSSFGEYPFV